MRFGRSLLAAAALFAVLFCSATPTKAAEPIPAGCKFTSNMVGGSFDCTVAKTAVKFSIDVRDTGAATGLLKFQNHQCVLTPAQIPVIHLAMSVPGGKLRFAFLKAGTAANCSRVGFTQF